MKEKIRSYFRFSPYFQVLTAVSVCIICLHLALRQNKEVMAKLSERLIRPFHYAVASAFDALPFSVAELMIALFITLILIFVIFEVCRGVISQSIARMFCRILAGCLSAGLIVYAGFCLLWGTIYYGEDFIASSGLSDDAVSIEQLEKVTAYFADLACEYSALVPRDENGVCICDREAVLASSCLVFGNIEREIPALAGGALHAKGICFSKVMSLTDFTGFFFPFTGEANVNMDSPESDFPATVAHELAHQRGVPREQDANFVAIAACLSYGEPEYVYSASLLAYTHLGNALASVAPDTWKKVYAGLNDAVRNDLKARKKYWQQFDTPVKKASNAVYEGFLQSYEQTLGLKSYGACVNLLVNYYYDAAINKTG